MDSEFIGQLNSFFADPLLFGGVCLALVLFLLLLLITRSRSRRDAKLWDELRLIRSRLEALEGSTGLTLGEGWSLGDTQTPGRFLKKKLK